MTVRNYSNIAVQTTLAAGISDVATSLTVTDATGYPAIPFAIVVDPGSVTSEEVMEVTAKAGTTFTVTRGFDGTTAKVHAAGATVIHAAIAGDFTDLQAADASEAAARAAADTAESAARAAADTALQTNITNEATARAAADVAHAALTTTAHGGIGTIAGSRAANTVFAGPPSGGAATPTFRAAVKADLPGVVAYEDEANIFTELNTFRDGVILADGDTNAPAFFLANGFELIDALSAAAFATYNGLGATVYVDAPTIGTLDTLQVNGITGAVYVYPTTVADLGYLRGLNFSIEHDGAGDVVELAGIFAQAYCYHDSNIVDMYGAEIYCQHFGSGGTVTRARGVYIAPIAPYGGGTIATAIGLHIDDQNSGTVTTGYAILTDGGETRHKAGAATTIPLVLQGAGGQTANLQDWRNSGGTALMEVEASGLIDFRATMGSSLKNPATDAPDGWIEIKRNGATKYIPYYGA